VKLVFLGSPPFGTPILARLLESAHRPALVVTPPDRPRGRGRRVEPSPLAALAREAGVPVLQPVTVRDDAFLADLRAEDADVFLVASYGELLRQEFLDIPKRECLNVHPSLLPRHRGATPIPAAILAGDEETGVTIQRVVLELDAGDVLVALRAPMSPAETAGELAARLAVVGGEATVRALDALADGTAKFTPQDPEHVTICRKLSKVDGRVDWARPAVELQRHVHAMTPWPGARTTLPGGAGIALRRARAVDGEGSPGTILAADDELVVAAGEGALALFEVQAAGKKPMPAGDFLRGARLEPGAVLGA
jgi:methionyl-tRNA formyltransferase